MATAPGEFAAPVVEPAASSGAPESTVHRAVVAVYIVFIGAGFGFASWASRIPQIRSHLRVSPGTLGLILLCIAVGSLISMPLSGLVIARLGEARTVVVLSLVFAVGLVGVALGYLSGIAPVAGALFLLGFGNGMWDVSMNVQAAAVEQALGRVIMPRFHAGFSIGTVGGAGVGAAMVALNVPVTAHLLGVAVVIAASVPVATRGFLPHAPQVKHERDNRPGRLLSAWAEPRTLIIGLFVLCMAFTEGTGNDWLSVAMIDGYRVSPALGSTCFAVFLAAMTTGRWFGPGLVERYGRVPVLRVSAAIAMAGLLLVVFGSVLPVALIGSVLWGLGTALGFPLGLSAAADDPQRSAGRVSVAASIGYVAFLGGPPLVGFVGDHVGVLRSLTVAVGVLAVALLASGATAPLRTDDVAESPP